MNVLRRLTTKPPSTKKIDRKASALEQERTHPRPSTRRLSSNAIHSVAREAPPAYTAVPLLPNPTTRTTNRNPNDDSPFAYLRMFDTIFLIDDSGSMAGQNWRETANALAAIAPICTEQDADGIDIYFLNHRNSRDDSGAYRNVTSASTVEEIFRNVRPYAGTPTGMRLSQILRPYLKQVEQSMKRRPAGEASELKPLNIIVITDGAASDDPESAIISAARRLDKLDAEPWQIGIQFFQVGQDQEAAEDLRKLDDVIAEQHDVRDMVDTVPWSGQDSATLTADGIMKVTMGAINRRLDRRRGSDEALRA